MTLGDIIEYYEKTGALGPKGYGLAELQLRTAALLKAGQAMRDAWQDIKDAEGFYAPNSCDAWDKLTKPEDV